MPPITTFAIYKSLDGLETGTATQAFSSFLLAVDPSDPETVYSEHRGRVARSRDGASTFVSLSAGLPVTTAFPSDFAIDATGTTVYLATDTGGGFNSGLYRMDLPPCATAADCDDGDACTVEACTAGRCEYTAVADGTPCTGVEVCTFSGTCSLGACEAAFGAVCNDGDPCTQDVCAVGGTCLHLGNCIPTTTTSSTTSTTAPTTTTTTTTLPLIQCCLPGSPMGAFTCVLETASACSSAGGANLGAGTCDPNPCGGTTTTTTAPSTTTTTTTTTISTTTTTGPTTTTTSTTLAGCFPSGSSCTTNADCCSNSCKRKGPGRGKVCR